MANIGGGRVLRVCDLCGGVDDHPRHILGASYDPNGEPLPPPSDEIIAKVVAAAPEKDRARLIRDLMDPTSSDRHLDCCAAAGCPSNTCAPQVHDAPGTGRKMLEHLVNQEFRFADRPDVVKGE